MSNWKEYKNGNYTVKIDLDNGTKIRETKADKFIAEKPESIDMKITNWCDIGCAQCHEGSTENGKHGQILDLPFYDTLLPYTEIACLAGDTIVHSEHGSIEIKKLKIGDKIYDSEYKLRTITNIQIQNKKSIKLDGKRGIHIRCSKDHPFISNGEQMQAQNLYDQNIDNLSIYTQDENKQYIIDMAKYIKPANEKLEHSRGGKIINDNTVRLRNSTKHIPRYITLTNDLMWLYGLFVAEGSRKGITLHIDEINLANRAEKIWNETFGNTVKYYINEEKHSLDMEFQSASLIEDWFVNELQVGKGARNKSLRYLYHINDKELIRWALIGLFDGDGCIRNRSQKNGNGYYYSASLKTTSKYLAYDVSYLLAKWFGIYATVYHGESPKRKFGDRVLNTSDYYSVEFYGYKNCMKIFYDYFDFVTPIQSQSKQKTTNKVHTIYEMPSCDLYDITLESGTHIFPINGYLLTHNCGGGNPLSHPDLIPFLKQLKERKLIPNMTVNQIHFMQNIDFIKELVDQKLIYGLGVSLVHVTDEFIEAIKQFPNAVIHVINGVVHPVQLEKLAHNNLKILVLGYKELRRGKVMYSNQKSVIEEIKSLLYNGLSEIINDDWFDVVSFDNLAIEQLNVRRLLSEEEWSEFYMGFDGSHTMFLDLVEKQFAQSSTSLKRWALTNDIKDMFDTVRGNTNE